MLIKPAGLADDGSGGIVVRIIKERGDPPKVIQLAEEALRAATWATQISSGTTDEFFTKPAVEAHIFCPGCQAVDAVTKVGDRISQLLGHRGLRLQTSRVEVCSLRLRIR